MGLGLGLGLYYLSKKVVRFFLGFYRLDQGAKSNALKKPYKSLFFFEKNVKVCFGLGFKNSDPEMKNSQLFFFKGEIIKNHYDILQACNLCYGKMCLVNISDDFSPS